MEIIWLLVTIFILLIGPALGSFFAVQVMRSNKITKSAGKKSQCDNCGKTLDWYELIPLLSYLLQRGKCLKCGKRIDFRVFLADVLGVVYGLMFAAAFWQFANTVDVLSALLYLMFHSIILVLMFYMSVFDLFTYSIPAKIVEKLLLFVIGSSVLVGITKLLSPAALPNVAIGDVGHLFSGLISGGFIYLLIRITKQKGMGWGDFYIATLIGLAVGWPAIVAAFYIMIFSATIAGLIYGWKVGSLKGLVIPLVPFMTFGYVGALLLGDIVVNILFGLV